MSRILQAIPMVMLALAGFTGPALAVDAIGLYANPEGTRTSIDVMAGEAFTIYLMIVEPSDPAGVQGWECSIEVPDNVTVEDWQLTGQALNISTPPEFAVGLAAALPKAASVLLATARCVARDESPGVFRIEAHSRTSVSPAAPCCVFTTPAGDAKLVSLASAAAPDGDGVVFGVNTGDQQIGQPVVPQVMALHPCSPNPFNPMTVLRFDLPAETKVNLQIYTLTGRSVATLVDKVLPAGSHEITWTGRDDSSRKLASGTYVYQLHAAGRTLTRKMTLLR